MEDFMYVRPPSQNRQRIKIPENYSGHAFTGNGDYSDMPPPVRQMPQRLDLPASSDTQEYEDLPVPPKREISETEDNTVPQNSRGDAVKEDNVIPVAQPRDSLLSLLLPPTNNSSHFPFGHGLGSEELLILGIMLLVFLHGSESGQNDNEFLILLALLLFSG